MGQTKLKLVRSSAKLRHRITFQSQALTTDSSGGYTQSWTDVTTVWADVEAQSQRNIVSERIIGGQVEARVVYAITTRYYAGITADMRIVFGTRVFNIRSVVNVSELNKNLEILAEEGVAL